MKITTEQKLNVQTESQEIVLEHLLIPKKYLHKNVILNLTYQAIP